MRYLLLFMTVLAFKSMALEKEALKEFKDYGRKLKKELKSALKVSDVTAIEICNIKAKEILDKRKSKIKIGRTSSKLRNPNNKPSKWMVKAMSDYEQGKITHPYVVVKRENGSHGILKPIFVNNLCLKCHGQNIDSKLYKEIIKKYPKDKAINYKAGQIRGYFWGEY